MFSFLGILLSSILFGVALVYFYFKKKFTYWSERDVPTWEPSIPLGNLKDIGTKIHLAHRFVEIYEKFKRNNLFAGFYFITSPRVVVTNLDLLRNILVKDFNSFHHRGLYYNEKADPLSIHLFNLDGPKWREFRTKLSPTFTSGKIKMMFPIMLKTTDDLRVKLKLLAAKKSPIDASDICTRFTADVIGSCAFGIECSCLTTENTEFMTEATRILDFSSPTRKLLTFFQNSFKGLATILNLRVFDAQSENFFRSIINDTIKYRENQQFDRNDFMQLLLQIHRSGIVKASSGEESDVEVGKMSFDEMMAQAFIFFIAGFETTSTTMSFALYELAANTDIQHKAREEAKRIFEKNGKQFTYEGVNEMNYIGQVVDETLRKYCPVHTLFREAVEDYPVPDSNKIIEKGTAIFVPVYAIHHDPDIYPEPDIFDPERFTPENVNSRHKFSFIPFGDGPRNCIGMRFGLLQAKLGLAEMLLNYKFTINSKTQIPLELDKSDLFMTPLGGIWLDVEQITKF